MTQIFDLFGLWDDADFPGEKWVKSEEYFWNWRIIVTYYSGLQIRKEKVEHFLTADCKSAGTPSGSTYRAQQYLRHRRIENRRPKGKPNLWDIKSKLSAIRWIKYPWKANYDTSVLINQQRIKRWIFSRKSTFYTIFSVLSTSFPCILCTFAAVYESQQEVTSKKLRLHATSK